MKLFDYQTYYIATDANHVTQHRRFVTPWFVKNLKSIQYDRCSFDDFDDFTFWTVCSGKDFISVRDIILKKSNLGEKLDLVTMVFNEGKV